MEAIPSDVGGCSLLEVRLVVACVIVAALDQGSTAIRESRMLASSSKWVLVAPNNC